MTTRDIGRGTEIKMGTWLRSGIEIVPIAALLCIHFSPAQADILTTASTETITSGTTGKAAVFSLPGTNVSTTTTIKPEGPRLTKVKPLYGPVSGGTEVSISGQDLNCKSPDEISLHLILGARHLTSYNCTKNSDVFITCLTPPSNNAETGVFELQVSCDTGNSTTSWMTDDTVMFTYKPDPVVISVFPNDSILAGGITQTVIGTDLDSVAQPRMWTGFDLPSAGQGQPCFVHNSTLLKCRTQPIESLSDDTVRTHPEEIKFNGKNVSIGFFLDGVTSFQNFAVLRMFHNPEIDKFKPDPKIFLVNENKALSIGVTWPYMNFTAEDVTVHIGTRTCTGVMIDENSTTCYPPPLPKSVIRYGPAELNTLEVTVSVGQLKRDIGRLHYTSTESFHVVISVMIAILVFIFVVSTAFGCCTYFGPQPSGCRGRAKKPPFRAMSDANEFDHDARRNDGSNIKGLGKRRAKRSGADAAKRDEPMECVVMQYRGEARDPL